MFNLIESGKLLKKLVKESKYSMDEICKMLNISRIAMYAWFRGESLPSLDNLFFLAEILDKRPDELIVYESILDRVA